MGFPSLLQGKHSHEALLSLQDAEIRLLENVKRCLGFRVKCDREYAIALNTMCMQAQKTDLGAELSGSLVVKAWKTIVEESETFSRLIKQNADHIACITSEKLNFLITEKRNCRKVYLEEHNRIEAELLMLHDRVMKGRSEYEKGLDNFKIAKAKYDEQVVKAKGSKRMEEAREKYVKACRKLHRIHNDYVLWLCEAAEYEKSFRTVLLPGLLEFQQNMQEELIDQWRTILSELVHYTDLSAAKFQELQGLMIETVEAITPASEYKEFMNKHKSPPPLPVMFIFDRTLVEDYSGKLKPNTLIVDDLTFTFLNLKLIELDEKIRICQQMIKEKQGELVKCENELSSLRKSAEMAPTLFIKRKIVETIRRELFELKSKERGYQKQKEILFGPLSQVTETGPSPALELQDSSNGEENVGHGSKLDLLKIWQNEPGGTLSKLHSRNLVQMLRKPFIKRQSMHALSTFNLKDTTLNPGAEVVKFYSQPSSPTRNKLIVHTDRSLQDEDWFHGVLPRDEVVRLLVSDGDFLVRETIRNNEQQIVVSVRSQGHKHFIVQLTAEGKYRFEGPAYPTIQELMLTQYRSGLPVTNKSGAVLRNPIFRERWELNNDDVELITKIGRGNFGDVFKARLQSNGQEVAAKTCHMTLPEEQKKKFLQEGRILKQYDHPNIVKLIGICVQKQPIMIVMELVSGGSLLSFLRNSGSSLSVSQKVTMSINCAAGMEYLESKNCIHRDLAARNCLIGKDNIVKISDFGMSREEEEYVVSDGMKQIPIKWTAPEALNFGKYTSLCDVWSYGVLVWEIFSNGSSPYSGLSNAKAREMIDSGYRMPAPDGTPEPAYKLMLRCWEYDCDLRPHFDELHASLLAIYRDIKENPEPGDNF